MPLRFPSSNDPISPIILTRHSESEPETDCKLSDPNPKAIEAFEPVRG